METSVETLPLRVTRPHSSLPLLSFFPNFFFFFPFSSTPTLHVLCSYFISFYFYTRLLRPKHAPPSCSTGKFIISFFLKKIILNKIFRNNRLNLNFFSIKFNYNFYFYKNLIKSKGDERHDVLTNFGATFPSGRVTWSWKRRIIVTPVDAAPPFARVVNHSNCNSFKFEAESIELHSAAEGVALAQPKWSRWAGTSNQKKSHLVLMA